MYICICIYICKRIYVYAYKYMSSYNNACIYTHFIFENTDISEPASYAGSTIRDSNFELLSFACEICGQIFSTEVTASIHEARCGLDGSMYTYENANLYMKCVRKYVCIQICKCLNICMKLYGNMYTCVYIYMLV